MKKHFESDLSVQDENLQINDISAKLAEIRRTLGIDMSDNQTSPNRNTPSDGTPNNKTNQNTFGKNLDTSQRESPLRLTKFSESKYKDVNYRDVNFIDVDDISGQKSNISQHLKLEPENQEQISMMQQQIDFLHGKLESLKQIYPQQQQDTGAQYLLRENEYLKMEVDLKSKQVNLLKSQVNKMEEQLSLENQQLRTELQQVKNLHQEYIGQSDLQGDIKSYIISLETDLFLTKQELNVLVSKISEEEQINETKRKELSNVESRMRKEIDHLYKRQIQELGYICQSLSAEVLQPSLPEQNTKLQKLYQDLLDEKFMLEDKIEQLESKLCGQEVATPSIKIIYENRMQNMKSALLLWKNRAQQVEQIVSQWFKKARDDLTFMKKDLIRKQVKMFKVFEEVIKQIHNSFNDEKVKMLSHIKSLTSENHNLKSKLRLGSRKL